MIKAWRPDNYPTPNAVQVGDYGQNGTAYSTVLSVSITNIEGHGALFFMGTHDTSVTWILGVRFALDNHIMVKTGMARAKNIGGVQAIEIMLPDTTYVRTEYHKVLEEKLEASFPGVGLTWAI